jgi:hypothetical protein
MWKKWIVVDGPCSDIPPKFPGNKEVGQCNSVPIVSSPDAIRTLSKSKQRGGFVKALTVTGGYQC